MISGRFSAILFLLGCLVGLLSAQPVRPFNGNPAYSVEADENVEEQRWGFSVYSDGYTKLNEKGKVEPVDTLMVNKVTKRLTVMKVMNAYDEVKPRMRMREILKACWEMTGLKPSELKTVMGWKIENENMQTALATCRTALKLKPEDSFTITSSETDPDRLKCWEAVDGTIFSAAIKGAIKDFDINKKLLELEVDNGAEGNKRWDHLYYRFSTAEDSTEGQ